MPSSLAARVAWYRFRCTLRERWGGYLALALLLGLVGGLAMGSVAAARRTQAAFPDYLASTNPSDLTVLTGLAGAPGSAGYDPALIRRIAALPYVRHVSSYAGLNVAILGPGGTVTPSAALLAAALTIGALSSLWLTLMAGVGRRRRDLALLKTLGFTRRQVAATVAWLSTAAVAAGAAIGVPLGIALGRFLWDLFARQISVVPEPAVPPLVVALVIAGALVTANLVAALPGWVAARTPAAAVLRAE